jgi:hypothetical protein
VAAVTTDGRIAVSPRHEVALASEYWGLIDKPPKRDFVVRTIMRREANDLLLMTAELVIAGEETRALHPLANTYPLHFRKTYFPGQMRGDPQDEFDQQTLASQIIAVAPPIGCTSNVFRSCMLPGQPYPRISPFGVEPDEMNVPLARKLPLASAAGLWRLAEQALDQLLALQAGGLSHGDAELHNFIVCPSPLELCLIDFGSAVRESALSREAWETRCALDLGPLLREAVFIQCALGRQLGTLAEMSWQRMDKLFKSPEGFRTLIARQAEV